MACYLQGSVGVEDSFLTSLHLADLFAAAVSRGPDNPFLIYGPRRLSYAQVDREAQVLAASLQDLGVRAGGRVATVLPNRPEAVITMLAASRIGAAVVPINPSLAYHELQYQLRQSGVPVVVAVTAWEGRDHLEWFEDLLADMPELRHVVAVGDDDVWLEDRIVDYGDLVKHGGTPRAAATRDADDLLAVLYTSGTAGKPKGVCHPHRSLVGNARETTGTLDVMPDDVALLAVPHFTVFGVSIVLGAIVTGTTLVLQERFAPDAAVRLMADERVTLCHGVPTMFALLLRERGFEKEQLPALRSGIIAGSPVAPDLVRQVRAVCNVEIAYGLTETGPTVTMTRLGDRHELRQASVGRVLHGVEARIVDLGEGTLHGAEAVGELALKSPWLMTGYDRMPVETRRVLTADGFFLTGDLAMLDAEGYVRIVGRRKETIIRGGFNVHPREVEDVLRGHPAVEDVCVIGVPHDVLGEMICACIVPVEGATVRSEDLIVFARDGMADYKVPDLVRFVDHFPLNASGKVQRRELARVLAPLQAAS